MTVEVRLSSTYLLQVQPSTFPATNKPCIALRMMYVGDGDLQQRGHMRFDRRMIPDIIDALEKMGAGR